MAERGIIVSYESIRLWCNKFGLAYSRRLKRRHQGFGDTFYIDEAFVNICGERHYLWRAVDQDGEVVATRGRERGMCGLKSVQQAQRFLSVHAAILAADVVGYSRLMGEDEAGTLERLKACEADVIEPVVVAIAGAYSSVWGTGSSSNLPA